MCLLLSFFNIFNLKKKENTSANIHIASEVEKEGFGFSLFCFFLKRFFTSSKIWVEDWLYWVWKWKPWVVSNSLWLHGLYSPQNSPGQNTGVGSCSLLQGIFPSQVSNRGLLHWRQIFFTNWATREVILNI